MKPAGPPPADAGTVLPLLLLGFLLATTVLAATTAGGAALVARRQLAAACDAAALAGAAALDRTALGGTGSGGGVLPLDPGGVRAAVAARLDRAGPPTRADVRTDGRTVVVRCRRTVRVPFGAVLGRPDGIERVATARARTVLRPST